jgi:hypothetical protein
MTSNKPELSEKDFINESYEKDPFPFWFWLFVVAAITTLIWSGSIWYNDKLKAIFQESPFLRVTNREMSQFLWQNPEFMRANVKIKNGYLTDFEYMDRVGLDPDAAEEYAIAPPELLFRYHTWQRLVGDVYIPLPIPKEMFKLFIADAQEWQPEYWPSAPKAYIKMLQDLPKSTTDDLSTLPEESLPRQVRIAFQGWKHFFYDGESINDLKPSKDLVTEFLSKFPNYARNYWRNIVEENFPDYLKDIDAQEIVPSKEMAPFLKVALYDYSQAQKK